MAATGYGALDGIRVIDLTQMLAGPFCTQLLADQGAEVIKVEPIEGEGARNIGPFLPDDRVRAFGGYFASINRNKRSIGLDLKHEEAKAILGRLAAGADVVVENYRAGVMERLGLGFEQLRANNQKLVYAAIRGFGDPRTGRSPYVDWPAFDVVAQAMGGLMQINGPDKDTPMKVGPGVGDLVPAALCAFGISAALLRAQRTGQGQFVDVSMVDSVLALCERIIHQNSFENVVPHPEGNRHPLLAPFGMLRAQDGYVTIAAHTDKIWAQLCKLIGREDLIVDTQTATQESRVRNRARVYDEVEGFTSLRSKAELSELFGGKIPFGPVENIEDIKANAHFAAREMIVQVAHPGSSESVGIAGIPVKMTETPGRIARRAPTLGEDTQEVLREAGYADYEIQKLRDQRIVS